MSWINEEFDDLDDPTTYAADPSGVYEWIEKSDEKFEEATKRYIGAIDIDLFKSRGIREVLICGMGGSAIAGDLACAAVTRKLHVPCRLIRGYLQPGSLGEGTLQIVVSYSGNTEEAIWAYSQGHNRGAHVVAIASGGALEDLAKRQGDPLIELPDDYPAPRLALGHLLPAVLSVLSAAFNGLDFIEDSLHDAATSLKRGVKRYARDLSYDKNMAKRIAYDIHQAVPVVIGSALTWPVALRFQTQLNENAKWPCFASMLPEMNHNEIVAYTQPGPATNKIGILMLRDKEDHPRVQFRQDFTLDMVRDRVAWSQQLKGEGRTHLGRMISMIQTADFASYYLAVARGLDPLDIHSINTLKERLGKLR